MQKITLKRAVPFKTAMGSVIASTVVVEDGVTSCSDCMTVLAIITDAGQIVRHGGKFVFARNTIVHSEPFTGNLP